VVDRIVDHRLIGDKPGTCYEYLVKWYGHQEKT